MSYFATSAPGREDTYRAFDDEDVMPSRAGDADTSGDEALARSLAQELSLAEANPKATELDEELAMALAMTMEGDLENDRDGVPPPPPPRDLPQGRQPAELQPQKQQVDTGSIAHSMFERLMAPFRRLSSTADHEKAKTTMAKKLRQRRSRQATVVMNVMEVMVPDFLATENFLVMKPDGSVSRIHVPKHLQRPPFYVTYDGEPLMNAPPRILDETEQNAAFLDYYRFNPLEIEAEVDIIPGPRPLGGLELVSQPEGVFIKWGVFPLPPSPRKMTDEYYDEYEDESDVYDDYDETEILETGHLICAGDLIVQVDGTPTTSLEALRTQIAAMRPGSKVFVRVLRRPPPLVRCPMGHPLHLDDPAAEPDAECDSCRVNFGRHHCAECGFSLCWPCHQLIYNHSKARFPRPVNNDHEFVEAPRSARLTFSPADVGVKVLIYWYTTAEWWIGQIEDFDSVKGHTVVYEERNGNKCKETIPNFAVREYRILLQCILLDDVESFHHETFGDIPEPKMTIAPAQTDDLLGFEEEKSTEVENPLISVEQPLLSVNATFVAPSQPATGSLLDLDEPLLEHPPVQMHEKSLFSVDTQHKTVVKEEEEEDKVVLDADEMALVKELLGEGGGEIQDDDDEDGPP